MSAAEVNIPLLRKAVEWAEAEAAKPPELREWDQAYYVLPSPTDLPASRATRWSDPTTWASWAVEVWEEKGKSTDCGSCFCIAGYIAHQATGNLDYSEAERIALEALGLDSPMLDNYDDLFSASNSIEDVRRIAEDLAGERL